jgi:Protein of unknown function (DUF4058)
MPSPFPGMDPYLESPFLWHGFHGFLIGEITHVLNAGLPEGLAANAEERVYIAPLERSIIPDIHLATVDYRAGETQQRTAVMDRTADHGIVAAYPEQERELFIAIRSLEDWDEIITIIEILSPTNKREDSPGWNAYLAQQRDTLYSNTNLMEIDLLRGGVHTVAAPKDELERHGRWDSLICVHRPIQAWHFEYWFSRIQDPLPGVSVPLTQSLGDFELGLQAAFGRAYDTGPYKRRIDYTSRPPGDLDAATLAWIDSWLRQKGLRQEPDDAT